MQEIVINIMNDWGYLGILLLIAIENIFPPIPSELILTFGGFITTCSDMNVIGVIIASTIGSEIGAIMLYAFGRMLNQERLEKLVGGKLGKLLHLKKEDIKKSYNWFQKKGKSAVLFCRCIPIVRSLISIPAGMTKMNLPYFLTLTLIGSAIWNTIIVTLGSYTGENFENVVNIIGEYSHFVWITLIVGITAAVIYRRKTRNKKRGEISIKFKVL